MSAGALAGQKMATSLLIPRAGMRPSPVPLPRVILADAAPSQGPRGSVDRSPCTLKPPGTSNHGPALRLLLWGGSGVPSTGQGRPKARAANSGKALGEVSPLGDAETSQTFLLQRSVGKKTPSSLVKTRGFAAKEEFAFPAVRGGISLPTPSVSWPASEAKSPFFSPQPKAGMS